MNAEHAASAYRQASIESAPPVKLVRMMLDGALRQLEKAARSDPKSDGSDFRTCARRADTIVSELRISLDPGPNPELVEQLEGLYLFCENQIGKALLELSVEPLDAAQQVLTKLKGAWAELEVQGDAGA